MNSELFTKLKNEFENELINNILSFWTNYSNDKKNHGFYGKVLNNRTPDEKANKGSILNSRILWTFSRAYSLFKNETYLDISNIAYDYLSNIFYDEKYNGLYWMADYKGNIINNRKQIYNIAFGIYALSEYYKSTGHKPALELAINLYYSIEKHAYDKANKGYIEAFQRDFSEISDLRLSDKDMNEKKSMNTHLHILEAYTNLLSVWPDENLKIKQKELINVFLDYIIDNKSYHLKLFFDETWNAKSDLISYGHDIESSWLLYEAANKLNEKSLIKKVTEYTINMADKTYIEGIDKKYGGIYDEKENGIFTSYKSWWPQAEAVVGFFNAYLLSNNEKYLNASLNVWEFIKKYIIDKNYGEWYNSISFDGNPNLNIPKISEWKCPYHNSRMCFEMIDMISKLKE